MSELRAPSLIAHRGGVGLDERAHNTYAAIGQAIADGCDYVEIDVQVTSDGRLVCYHDDSLMMKSGKVKKISEITYKKFRKNAGKHRNYEKMVLWCRGLIKLHLDIKISPNVDIIVDDGHLAPHIACVEKAVAILGQENVIVSAFNDQVVKNVVQWSQKNNVHVLVGLTLGTGRDGGSWVKYGVNIIKDLFPERRLALTGATMIVALGIYARLTLASTAQRRHLPLLVWTIDKSKDLAYWKKHGHAFGVITNFPQRWKNARD